MPRILQALSQDSVAEPARRCHASLAAETIHGLLARHAYVHRYQHYPTCDDWYVYAG